MNDSVEMLEDLVREKLYNFLCELGWDCPSAEEQAESIVIPIEALESYSLDI
jgi:hypothetical protein